MNRYGMVKLLMVEGERETCLVQIVDDLFRFDVELGVDFGKGTFLSLSLPEQGFGRWDEGVDGALGSHQDVPDLIDFLGNVEQGSHLLDDDVQLGVTVAGSTTDGWLSRDGYLECMVVDNGRSDVRNGSHHFVHLLGEELDQNLEVSVHAGHGGADGLALVVSAVVPPIRAPLLVGVLAVGPSIWPPGSVNVSPGRLTTGAGVIVVRLGSVVSVVHSVILATQSGPQ